MENIYVDVGENIDYSVPKEIKLIDRSGNIITDIRNYKNAYICMVFDKSIVLRYNVRQYADNHVPYRLPDNTGLFFIKHDVEYGPEWIDMTPTIQVLHKADFITFNYKNKKFYKKGESYL